MKIRVSMEWTVRPITLEEMRRYRAMRGKTLAVVDPAGIVTAWVASVDEAEQILGEICEEITAPVKIERIEHDA